MKKVAAVVVTFNRFELLQKVVDGLRNQTRKIDQIIIVNNSSSDGTEQWLSEQTDLHIITQANLGSSGGQYAGSKYAFEQGFDYIWLMDDDVIATNSCLETLLKFTDKADIVCPQRYNHNSAALNDITHINLTNPLKSIWKRLITKDDIKNELVFVEGFTFEGPLISKQVFEKIGLPELGFFIYGDDTEFSIRANKSGFKAAIVRDTKILRQISSVADKSSFTWKHYYLIRNLIAIDRLHGNAAIRYVRPFGYLATWLLASNNWAEAKTVLRAFKDGMSYKSKN